MQELTTIELLDHIKANMEEGMPPMRGLEILNSREEWDEADGIAIFFGSSYRVKPRTIEVNGVRVTAPVCISQPPSQDQKYYIPDLANPNLYQELSWNADEIDTRLLDRGLIHTCEEDAIARARAMMGYKNAED